MRWLPATRNILECQCPNQFPTQSHNIEDLWEWVEQELKRKQTELTYFNNAEDLWKLSVFSGIEQQNKTDAAALLDSKSNYFTAQIEVVLSERKRQFSSSLVRKDKQVSVYSRSLVPFEWF